VDRLAELPHDLHGHGALAGDHVRVIERRDVGVTVLVDQLVGVGCGLIEGVALEHHPGTVVAHRAYLDLRRGLGHHDHRLDSQLLGGQGHTLGVVAGGGADYPLGLLLLGQMGNPVVGAANLEGKHRLKIFPLEQNVIAKALGQAAGFSEGCFDRHVVDAGIEDLLDIALRHDASVRVVIGENRQCRKFARQPSISTPPSEAIMARNS
jgi:hypothetical protein